MSFRRIAVAIAAALLCPAAVTPPPAAAQPASAAPDSAARAGRPLARARSIIANARRIVSSRGVEELLAVPVGGTTQWVAVRGRDRRNPILLMIHGGPASPEMPTSWAFQQGWEDYFTVVQWDQRGAGKSYTANDTSAVAPTLSLARIAEDAVEVVRFLQRRYGKDRVIVLGHSWGSLVGLTLAHRHPELLHAYVGMGQVVSGRENERVSYARTLAAAEARRDTAALRELRAIAPYPEADGAVPLADIAVERKWSNRFGGLVHGRAGIDHYLDLAELAPEYSAADVAAIDRGSALSLPRLLPDLAAFDYSAVTTFRCPIVMFLGRHDTTTPSEVAAAWMTRVRAPVARVVWFEESAHMPMVEEPGRMLVHLVQQVLPLATGDRPGAPVRR